ncbi:MAG TPA: hypothetical protein VFH92_09555 [Phenylobacterium sp.]|nr:hypothetical protein [Phenylobacterium sp.]
MAVFLAALVLLIALILAARAFGLAALKPWTTHLDTLQTVLTLGAAMIGAVWYFFERPQAAKLDLTQQATGVALPDNRVMILVEVSPKNLGGAAIDFSRSPYSLEIGQVTPLTLTPYREGEEPAAPGVPRRIHPAERWSPLAAISYAQTAATAAAAPGQAAGPPADPTPALTSFVEAGETENLYFRAIVPCKPGLSVYVTSHFEKPQMLHERLLRRPRLSWIKQTYLDLSPQCPKPTPSKTKQQAR